MSTDEKADPPMKDPEAVVIQHKFTQVMYEKSPQPLYLSRCVQKVFISGFYGQFTIYDQSGRELGTSKNGTLYFAKSKLQTEAASVWYEALAGYSDEYKDLIKRNVMNVGLNFSLLSDITILFHDAPDGNEEPNRTFNHIPVYYSVHNVWNSETKKLLYVK